MQFAQAEYLNLLWGMPILAAFLFWMVRRRRRRLERLVSPQLAALLAGEHSTGKAYLRVLFLLGFFLFGILALARPQWGVRLEVVRRRGVDIIAALDTSFSMNAEDVAPSRLQKARTEIRSLIERLRGDRVGLVCFAGSAVLQCPLTLDYGAVIMFLDVADTQIVPDPGTSLAAAISTADASFIAKERKYKVLVLFTDGEDLEGEVDQAARKARDAGVIIYAVGIGTPEGRPIPVRDADGNIVEYRKDENDQVVVSRLDERNLARVAEATGGRYYRATTSEEELDQLYRDISGMEKKELDSRLFQNLEDRFQYPLGLALVFLVASLWLRERRKRSQLWRGRFVGQGETP
jgi:Ca-activated chloride channel family protein